MKRLSTLSLVALLAALAAAPAQAQYHHYQYQNDFGGINGMQTQMQSRISRGISDGRLSPREAQRLQLKLSQIANLEAHMRMSGMGLSFGERNRLMAQLSNLNRDITRDLNDIDHRRFGYWGHRSWQ